MAVSSPTFKPVVSIGAVNITIVNTLTDNLTGKAQIALPDLTKSLTIRSRIKCELKISTIENGDYITLKPHCTLRLDGLEINGKILYIESTGSITTIEALITHG